MTSIPTCLPITDRHRASLVRLQRRRYLRDRLSFGALSLLSAFDLRDAIVDQMVSVVQAGEPEGALPLFDTTRLMPTFRERDITEPDPAVPTTGERALGPTSGSMPAFMPGSMPGSMPVVIGDAAASTLTARPGELVPCWDVAAREAPPDAPPWDALRTAGIELHGRLDRRGWIPLSLLASLPRVEQITPRVCVEGTMQIQRWGGVPLGVALAWMGADRAARHVVFRCADGYVASIGMPLALHPQTLLAFAARGSPLTPAQGAPLRLSVPATLGFRHAKHIVSIEVTDRVDGGFWERHGYDWFAGLG